MSYLVLARKYRPQTFADMTGQEHVVRTLANAIAADRVAHAYLFCGPRGVGKTTAARLLAKALNCVKGPTSTPCGECLPCTEIAAGNCVDVSEIDGASNNGVENVREIREAARYLPGRDRSKIYIIDEVHMLTGAAFNALLKTLEEPPPHVKFIFATTEPHKLPDTILSRCQRHNFRRIPTAMMIARLREILAAEGAKVSDRSLSMVARQSEGGMRDALSLLDGLLSAAGKEPSDEAVAEALGVVDRTLVHRLAKAQLERNGQDALAVVEEVYLRGVDLKRLAEELAFYFRHILVAKVLGSAPEELAESDRKAVLDLAGPADAAQITRLFELALAAVETVGDATQPRLALEVALLKGIHLAPGAGLAVLVDRLDTLSVKLGATVATTGGGSSGVRPASAGAAPGASYSASPAANAAPARMTTGTPPNTPTSSAAPALRIQDAPVRALASVPDLENPPPEMESESEPARSLNVDSSPGGCATGECLPDVQPMVPTAVAVPGPPPVVDLSSAAGDEEPEPETHRAHAPGMPHGHDDPMRMLADRWKAALETVKRRNARLADSLSHARCLGIRLDEVAVAFTGDQAGFHRMQCERPQAKNELLEGFKEHFGRQLRLVVEANVASVATVAEATEHSPAQELAQRRKEREDRLKGEAREHPAVKAAMSLFGGTLQEIRVRDEIPRPVETEDDSADV